MNEQLRAVAIVDAMYEQDAFSQWLGVDIQEVHPGNCVLRMTVRHEMLNGFGIVHGGITYSLADSALAFASNSHGRRAVSVETSVSHTKAVHAGDTLTATAAEEHLGRRTAIYRIVVENQKREVIALLKGTVYRKKEEW